MHRLAILLIIAALAAVLPAPARAVSHLWHFTEIYSNAAGTIQFVELEGESDNQHFLDTLGNTLSSNLNPLLDVFGSDLSSSSTNGAFLLIGSTSYAALGGVPAPDYTMPDNFFSVLGDTLIFQDDGTFGLGDMVTFAAVDLPTDGINSLHINGGFSQDVNSPTNFAGETGSIPEPSAALLFGCALGGLAFLRRRPRPRLTHPRVDARGLSLLFFWGLQRSGSS